MIELVRRRLGPDGERGASAVEFAMIMPVFLPLIFLLVQAGLYFHAVNVTQAVAQTTSRVLRTLPANEASNTQTLLPNQGTLQADAQRIAVETWQSLDANKTSSEPVATADIVPVENELSVTIQSKCVNLLPGILPDLPVNARASGPIEIFKGQGTN
jgi:Flp pilus assembly protein TadG